MPRYWTRSLPADAAARHPPAVPPGTDFAAYRWAHHRPDRTRTDQSSVHRSRAGAVRIGRLANLLQSLDRRLQEKVLDPDAVAPIARLMAVGDVLLRLDLQTDRFHLVSATDAWRLFTADQPRGLTAPRGAARKCPVVRSTRGSRASSPRCPDRCRRRSRCSRSPSPSRSMGRWARPLVVVAGDGEGLVDLASAGLLNGAPPADPVRRLVDTTRRAPHVAEPARGTRAHRLEPSARPTGCDGERLRLHGGRGTRSRLIPAISASRCSPTRVTRPARSTS